MRSSPIEGYRSVHSSRWIWTTFALVGVLASAGWGQPAPLRTGEEFRGFWADAFQAGFKSVSQIDTMISRAQAGRYNAIVAEVLAYQDTGAGGHGAYWNSSIVPKASDVSGGIDPLAELVSRAHAAGIEVHAWLVAYRVSKSWPPSGNSFLGARPEWIMVPLASMGGGPAKIDGKYTLDPGSPDVQEYLISIVRELVSNYEIDGVHWDYIRYTQTDAGYPAHTWYAKSGLERFRAIEGYAGTPPDDDPDWENFRRKEINELVRRAYAEIHANDPDGQQPRRHSAALIASGDAPSSFSNSDAYLLFQNWEYWLAQGWLDAACPMNYKREHCASQAQWYRNWVDAAIGWGHGRHVVCGQGNYLNSFANSVTQLTYVYGAGADGSLNYSYIGTRSTETLCDDNDDWVNDTTWYNYVASNLFTTAAQTPAMPWHDPAIATKGSIYGRVTDGATGAPIDDATISINGFPVTQTDGNGFYLLTNLTSVPGGIAIPISALADGYAEVVRPAVLLERAGFTEANFGLGTWLPGDYDVDGDVDLADYERFARCITGPGAVALAAGCDLFDFDLQADVDLEDYHVFQGAFAQ